MHNVNGHALVNTDKVCDQEKVIDVTDSESVIHAVYNGKNILRKVKVYDIKNKCEDLWKALEQQQGVFGSLPISNLWPAHIKLSLQPSEILSYEKFDPIKLHHRIFKSGKYNYPQK